MSIDRIDGDLRAAMQQAVNEDRFAPTPVVKDYPAIVVAAEGYSPKSGGDQVLLLEVKLEGGEHDGVSVRDYLGIRDNRPNIRGMALRRLAQAMAATGCANAPTAKAMVGKRLLLSTREGRPGDDGKVRVYTDRYSAPPAGFAPQAPVAPAPAPSASSSIPPFAQGR